jgi:hypothetical protein
MYPQIKTYQEYNEKDVTQLVKHNKIDTLQTIASNINGQGHTSTPKFLTHLASLTFDRNVEVCQLVYQQMKKHDLEITPTLYNYFVLNAVQFY